MTLQSEHFLLSQYVPSTYEAEQELLYKYNSSLHSSQISLFVEQVLQFNVEQSWQILLLSQNYPSGWVYEHELEYK